MWKKITSRSIYHKDTKNIIILKVFTCNSTQKHQIILTGYFMVIKKYFYSFKHEMILWWFLKKKQNSTSYPLEIHNNLGGDIGVEKRSNINVTSLLKLVDGHMEIHYTGFLSSK